MLRWIPLFISRLISFSPRHFYLSCNPAFSITFLSFHHFLSGFLGFYRGLGGLALGQTMFMLLLSRVPLRRASEMSISFPHYSHSSHFHPPLPPPSPSHIATQTFKFHRAFLLPGVLHTLNPNAVFRSF